MDAEKRCGECESWKRVTEPEDGNWGECRKHPPQAIPCPEGFKTGWPMVQADEKGCGEWDFNPVEQEESPADLTMIPF